MSRLKPSNTLLWDRQMSGNSRNASQKMNLIYKLNEGSPKKSEDNLIPTEFD